MISDVVTGPGGAGSGWAELMLVDVTANAPIASNALAPMVAEPNFICFEFTFDHSRSVCVVSHSKPAARLNPALERHLRRSVHVG